VRDESGRVTDVRISYPLSLEQQMLEYSGKVTVEAAAAR
jgi:hypothetical protein